MKDSIYKQIWKSKDNNAILIVGDFGFEISNDNNVVRVINYKTNKMIKWWYNDNIIQTANEDLPCDIINEYTDIFYK